MVTKPPKPSSSVLTLPTWGVIGDFQANIFLPGDATFIEHVFFFDQPWSSLLV